MGSRRRGGVGREAVRVSGSRAPKDRPKHPEGMMGRHGARHAVCKNKSHLYIAFKCSQLLSNLFTD